MTQPDRLALERNQAVAFEYWKATYPMLVDGGTILSDRPAPMSATDLAWVMRQLGNLPGYRKFVITAPAQDGTIVTLSDGNVTTQPPS